jgi:hypothetical protein
VNDENPAVFSQMAIPVSFCCLERGSDLIEYATKTVSILPNGFVMSSPLKLKLGSRLSLRLRVPSEMHASPFHETRCVGLVVSEHNLKGGLWGTPPSAHSPRPGGQTLATKLPVVPIRALLIALLILTPHHHFRTKRPL